LIVGAPQFAGGNGAAYIFTKSGNEWMVAAKLTSGNSKSILFGTSVAVGSNVVMVGTPDDNNGAGAVYVFVKPQTGWKDMLPTAELGANGRSVGASLAMSADGTTLVAGGPTQGAGGAYLFLEPDGGWTSMTEAAATLFSATGYEVGLSVAMSGDTVVVGELGTSTSEAAYVFVKPTGGWSGVVLPAATLTASDGHSPIDEFGHSVAIAGNMVAVGAPYHPNYAPGAGYVYVEPKSGWQDMTQTAELNVPVHFNMVFGQAVAIKGNLVLAGAPGNAIGHNSQQGSVFGYLKPPTGWKDSSAPSGAATASNGVADELFGDAIAVSGDTVAVGAPYYDGLVGAVYIFSVQ
jgi:FG-GAP repeat